MGKPPPPPPPPVPGPAQPERGLGKADDGLPAGSAQYPCKRCGASLAFAPGTSALACPYCGEQNAIAAAKAVIHELDYQAHLAKAAESQDTVDRIVSKCDSCGAEVQFPDNVTSHKCPFCAEPVVAARESAKALRPRSVLPFKLDARAALASYRKWLASRWFVPSDLKRSTRVEDRFNGVYLPYWTYDAKAHTRYTGARGEHYYVTTSYTDSEGRRQTRRERRTRWYPAAGLVHDVFDDVLVPASTSLPQNELDKLEPWDLPELAPYDDAFLAGFRAESYTVDLPAGFAGACVKMEPKIRASIRRDIGGDVQQIHTMQTSHSEVTFKHLLLPVWVATYRYKKRLFRVLVNARTGEVIGKRPYSWIKISVAIIAGLMFVGMIVALVMLAK